MLAGKQEYNGRESATRKRIRRLLKARSTKPRKTAGGIAWKESQIIPTVYRASSRDRGSSLQETRNDSLGRACLVETKFFPAATTHIRNDQLCAESCGGTFSISHGKLIISIAAPINMCLFLAKYFNEHLFPFRCNEAHGQSFDQLFRNSLYNFARAK